MSLVILGSDDLSLTVNNRVDNIAQFRIIILNSGNLNDCGYSIYVFQEHHAWPW